MFCSKSSKSGVYVSVWTSHVSSMQLLSVAGAPSWSSVCSAPSLSHVCLFVTPRTVASKATLSTEFSKQQYWSGLPFPIPGYLLDLGIESVSLESLILASRLLPLHHLESPKVLLYNKLEKSCPQQSTYSGVNPTGGTCIHAALMVETKQPLVESSDLGDKQRGIPTL